MTKPSIITSLRPQFWILSLIPGCVGFFLSGGSLLNGEIILLIAILSAVSGIAELVNDYVDQTLDKFQKVKRFGCIVLSGGSSAAHCGGVDREKAFLVLAVLAIITLLGAIFVNLYVLLFALCGLFISVGYSLKPFRFKSRGVLGLVAMAIGRGFISFHLGWLVFSSLTIESVAIGIFLSLLAFGTASLAHLADYEEDQLCNITTFPVLIGFEKAARIAACAIITSFLLLAIAMKFLSISTNIVLIPVATIGLIMTYILFTTRTENIHAISRLQLLGVSLFCLAPLVFVGS